MAGKQRVKIANRMSGGSLSAAMSGTGVVSAAVDQPGTIALTSTAITVTEGNNATIRASRTGVGDGAVAVNYAVSGVTTTPQTGTLNWPNNVTGEQSTTVLAGLVESNTSGTVTLSNARRTDGGTPAPTLGTASGTITVNDSLPPGESPPTVVITDAWGATSGVIEVMGPGMASFHATASTLTVGDWLNARIEWDFGDPTGRYNSLRGFSAGHLYEHEPASNTEFTVTCTITQQDGSWASATRTVRVLPNTRAVHYIDPDIGSASPVDPSNPATPWDTLANALAGTGGGNLDFRLTAGVVHPSSGGGVGTSRSNIIVRSATAGVSATVSGLTLDAPNSGFKDLHYASRGTSASAVRMLNTNTSTDTINSWLADITADDVRADVMTSGANDVSALLLNVQSDNISDNNSIWMAMQMLTILGCNIRHDGTERPMRGGGSLLLVHDTVASTTLKTACTFAGVDGLGVQQFVYMRGCHLTHETGDDGGDALNIAHTSGAGGSGVEWAVVEQTYCDGDLVVVPTADIPATHVVVRNCIVDGQLSVNGLPAANDVREYHNTVIGTTQHIVNNGSNWDEMYFRGNLCVGYNTAGTFSIEVFSFRNFDGRTFSVENNVIPAISTATNAVRLNGGTRISLAAMDSTYSWASGNRAYTVTLDGNYRPSNPSEPSILVPAEEDMAAFAEDYYGNARAGSNWTAGAVGEI